MHYKIDKTGCGEYQGMVRIKASFYFDEVDAGYSSYYVDTYARELTEEEVMNEELRKNVPLKKHNTPFHNHFFLVEPGDQEIGKKCEAYMHEAFGYWSKGKFPNIKNPKHSPKERTKERLEACALTLSNL